MATADTHICVKSIAACALWLLSAHELRAMSHSVTAGFPAGWRPDGRRADGAGHGDLGHRILRAGGPGAARRAVPRRTSATTPPGARPPTPPPSSTAAPSGPSTGARRGAGSLLGARCVEQRRLPSLSDLSFTCMIRGRRTQPAPAAAQGPAGQRPSTCSAKR